MLELLSVLFGNESEPFVCARKFLIVTNCYVTCRCMLIFDITMEKIVQNDNDNDSDSPYILWFEGANYP